MTRADGWNPPFVAIVEQSDGAKVVLGEGLNYPQAIQLRNTWCSELVRLGFSRRFNSNRLTRGNEWRECRLRDTAGREIFR